MFNSLGCGLANLVWQNAGPGVVAGIAVFVLLGLFAPFESLRRRAWGCLLFIILVAAFGYLFGEAYVQAVRCVQTA